MLLKPLCIGAVLAGGVLALVGLHRPSRDCCPGACLLSLLHASAVAEDKKDDKPALSGTWAKKEGQLKIEFSDKNVMKLAPHGDSDVIAVVCEYKVEKGGLVKAKVTGYEGKEEIKKKIEEKVPVGVKFSFKWKVKDDTATLDDVKGDKDIEVLKNHLEGDFEKK